MLIKLRKIQKKKYPDEKELIPKLYDYGSMIVKDKLGNKELWFYQVMPRYKQTLEEWIESRIDNTI